MRRGSWGGGGGRGMLPAGLLLAPARSPPRLACRRRPSCCWSSGATWRRPPAARSSPCLVRCHRCLGADPAALAAAWRVLQASTDRSSPSCRAACRPLLPAPLPARPPARPEARAGHVPGELSCGGRGRVHQAAALLQRCHCCCWSVRRRSAALRLPPLCPPMAAGAPQVAGGERHRQHPHRLDLPGEGRAGRGLSWGGRQRLQSSRARRRSAPATLPLPLCCRRSATPS